MVYASLLKVAYTLLPFSEIDNYVKGMIALRLGLAGEKIIDEYGNKIDNPLTKEEREKCVEGLPDVGLEITICDSMIKKELNVCLLKKTVETDLEPNLLFAFQMGWHTLIIPVLSDNYVSGENCKFSALPKDNMVVRTLDFHKIEEEYVLNFSATEIEIPNELYDELTNDLRKFDFLL
jgi:hypothetical protein